MLQKKIVVLVLSLLVVFWGLAANAAISLDRPPAPQFDTPIKSLTGFTFWLEGILGWVSAIFWILAIGFIIYAAFLYLTAAGEDETLKKAKQQLWYAVIAVAIALMATVIPTFVANFLRGY